MLIAISGGIGSGKSVVSRMVTVLGFDVYDCDNRAKALMDTDLYIKERIRKEIHPECILTDNGINRKRLADIVFNDAAALDRLNQIVHSAVRDDIRTWEGASDNGIKFVETAILYQSGLDKMVDMVWEIDAPLDLRIERVMKRNSITREEVLSRIASQDAFTSSVLHHKVKQIINDGILPLLPQIEKELADIVL